MRCLNDFIEAQTTYYAQCQQYMQDLQRQLGRYVMVTMVTRCLHLRHYILRLNLCLHDLGICNFWYVHDADLLNFIHLFIFCSKVLLNLSKKKLPVVILKNGPVSAYGNSRIVMALN